jgi:hypothetical protein
MKTFRVEKVPMHHLVVQVIVQEYLGHQNKELT